MVDIAITGNDVEEANQCKDMLYPDWPDARLDPDEESEGCLVFEGSDYMIWKDKDPEAPYVLQQGVLITGRWTMPNGDPGYPDEYDVVDIQECSTFREALLQLFLWHASDKITNTMEAVAMEREYRREERATQSVFNLE